VIVEGEEGYRQAKDFMKLLMPSHARRVQHYSDAVPLFQRNHVEDQLAAMYNPVVQLKSGGYLVINPTEALVSIDINSGRSTREHNIEQTATATNLEAAAEIARQLRLRDMAGLVVIDFIDMDNNSNVRKVEKAMKLALANDRARIQVGRISSFGLMEMSRQRLRTGVLEASTRVCPHCEGTGLVRTASSAGLSALRLLEDEAARGRGSQLRLRASMEAAFYLLNRKRADIAEIEERYGVTIEVQADGEAEGARMNVDVGGPPPAHAPRIAAPIEEPEDDYVEEIDEEEIEAEEDAEAAPRERRPERARDDEDSEGRSRRRRRRRGRRGRRDEEGNEIPEGEPSEDGEAGEEEAAEVQAETAERPEGEETERSGEPRKRRRRGRRGGRRGEGEGRGDAEGASVASDEAVEAAAEPQPAPAEIAEAAEEEAPKRGRRRPRARPAEAEAAPVAEVAAPEPEAVVEPVEKPKRTRRKKADAETELVTSAEPIAPVEVAVEPEAEAPKPKRTRRKKTDVVEEAPAAIEAAPAAANDANDANGELGEEGTNPDGTPRRGWWQRTFGA